MGLRVLHPTDFSEASEVAFVHALKLALVTQGQLHILHVDPNGTPVQWQGFPGIREALERWGALPPGSPREAVTDLGIDVEKVYAYGRDPVMATADFLQRRPADVIVLATHQRDGLAGWRQPSVAEAIARNVGEVTLFVPAGRAGFVSTTTGDIHLRRILIPVDAVPSAQPAIDAAAAMAAMAEPAEVTLRVVHVGDGSFPDLDIPKESAGKWERRALSGDVVTALGQAIQEWGPDLVVMTTEGRHGFIDGLRGSTTERVLRGAPCPVLAVPVSGRALRQDAPR
jgi:nucleotide-binding universal stress UspA family protein